MNFLVRTCIGARITSLYFSNTTTSSSSSSIKSISIAQRDFSTVGLKNIVGGGGKSLNSSKKTPSNTSSNPTKTSTFTGKENSIRNNPKKQERSSTNPNSYSSTDDDNHDQVQLIRRMAKELQDINFTPSSSDICFFAKTLRKAIRYSPMKLIDKDEKRESYQDDQGTTRGKTQGGKGKVAVDSEEKKKMLAPKMEAIRTLRLFFRMIQIRFGNANNKMKDENDISRCSADPNRSIPPNSLLSPKKITKSCYQSLDHVSCCALFSLLNMGMRLGYGSGKFIFDHEIYSVIRHVIWPQLEKHILGGNVNALSLMVLLATLDAANKQIPDTLHPIFRNAYLIILQDIKARLTSELAISQSQKEANNGTTGRRAMLSQLFPHVPRKEPSKATSLDAKNDSKDYAKDYAKNDSKNDSKNDNLFSSEFSPKMISVFYTVLTKPTKILKTHENVKLRSLSIDSGETGYHEVNMVQLRQTIMILLAPHFRKFLWAKKPNSLSKEEDETFMLAKKSKEVDDKTLHGSKSSFIVSTKYACAVLVALDREPDIIDQEDIAMMRKEIFYLLYDRLEKLTLSEQFSVFCTLINFHHFINERDSNDDEGQRSLNKKYYRKYKNRDTPRSVEITQTQRIDDPNFIKFMNLFLLRILKINPELETILKDPKALCLIKSMKKKNSSIEKSD